MGSYPATAAPHTLLPKVCTGLSTSELLSIPAMPLLLLVCALAVLPKRFGLADMSSGLLLQDELIKNRCRARSVDVWQRGVDTDVFNPKHKTAAMRERMTDGHPDAPLLVYVGRLGAEKNVEALKNILQQVGCGVKGLKKVDLLHSCQQG